MRECIVTEFWKMKRYSVIKAGVAMMVLSVLMSFFYSTANTSVGSVSYTHLTLPTIA